MKTSTRSVILGAAFLMATSAIGPGFITQTTVFTQQLLTSFGFVILISILLDIAAQLNVWRIIAVTEMRAQDLANTLLPGMGYLLAVLIVAGGLVFNIGNVAGAGLGMNVVYPFDSDLKHPVIGAGISAAIALFIFWFREAGVAMDWFARILGFVMIGLTLYVAFSSHPPVAEAVYRSFVPVTTNTTAILTLVGGTVGGYISFAGAHRLLDAGIKGKEQLPQVTRSSVSAILIASTMRILLFLAALGVVSSGAVLNKDNPAGSVFQIAAGNVGYRIFGIVLWSAAITSVVGSAYTSVSFLRTLHPVFEKYQRLITSLFILFSMGIFTFLQQGAVQILVIAGALNGLILPLSLALLLTAVLKKKLIGDYKHPVWLSVAGWIVVVIMGIMGGKAIAALLF
ncbi:natural resistance-associated macrophage protein [Niastella koreensis GR20-10]|uniref:Natural resistance-associated macrophage protein n=2 Tax=Niastella koreensis TaxID=354356 RepID=G8T835_NIAKG|nr:NRAMP family divalent metal transporter [Niastella koreensis]AEV97986.1 natural resistance-associated macrophage protein [Niastella koreensis GR20-10]